MFSHIQCPECKRKFGPKAAENHIKYCTEKAKVNQLHSKPVTNSPLRIAKKDYGRNSLMMTTSRNSLLRTSTQPGAPSPFNINPTPTPSRSRMSLKNVKSRVDTGLSRNSRPSSTFYSGAQTERIIRPSNPVHSKQIFITRFCTRCGYKFQDQSHKFCGECGQ